MLDPHPEFFIVVFHRKVATHMYVYIYYWYLSIVSVLECRLGCPSPHSFAFSFLSLFSSILRSLLFPIYIPHHLLPITLSPFHIQWHSRHASSRCTSKASASLESFFAVPYLPSHLEHVHTPCSCLFWFIFHWPWLVMPSISEFVGDPCDVTIHALQPMSWSLRLLSRQVGRAESLASEVPKDGLKCPVNTALHCRG